jgi:hypothetical protein
MRAELERKREELCKLDARIAAHPDSKKKKGLLN